jgi:acetate CoA/acetoacetate CoA-transferase beta subunit
MEAKDIIARRVAREVKPEMLVNLGIGLPSLVANFLPKDVHVFFQAENGVIGLGPRPPEGMEDPDLTTPAAASSPLCPAQPRSTAP